MNTNHRRSKETSDQVSTVSETVNDEEKDDKATGGIASKMEKEEKSPEPKKTKKILKDIW